MTCKFLMSKSFSLDFLIKYCNINVLILSPIIIMSKTSLFDTSKAFYKGS